jgi:hypothetical protein
MFDEVFESILSQKTKNDFIYPFYEKYCISNIPALILDLFNIKQNKKPSNLPGLNNTITEKTVNKVILFILDGFGLTQFLQYRKKSDFFQSINKKGAVFPLTSIFPSQTTNALATLNTGLTPQEHGLFEYFLYLKKTDMIVNTLRFEPMFLENQEYFNKKGFDLDILFKGKTLHRKLRENSVKSFCHMYIRDAYSACSKLFCDGSTIIPSLKASDLIVNLRKTLEKTKGPAYFFVHLGNLDTIAHQYGPKSEEYYTELSLLISLLKNHLVNKIDNKTSRETLLLLTSDHGELDVIPEKTTYLNHFPELIKNLQCNKRGVPILPTGSPRDIFLHVKEERNFDTQQFLIQKIGKKAKIIKTTNAIKSGLFGIGKVKKEFSERVGDLLVLPYDNETIWFDHFKNRKFASIGHHGGLNQNEMLVPFMLTKLSDLK